MICRNISETLHILCYSAGIIVGEILFSIFYTGASKSDNWRCVPIVINVSIFPLCLTIIITIVSVFRHVKCVFAQYCNIV